ncbi:MAG: ribbon-helix-helix protein, CopG family [Chloroflexi bacterium]|nr:ribbon-helix-helix protein, CopG family [Chloroflexota bacterium]
MSVIPLDIRDSCFSLPPEMFEQLQRVKDEEGRDMSELVREALRLYMEDRELRREQRLERLRSRQANQSEENGGHSDE